MNVKNYILAIFSPRASRELALNQSGLTALAVTAINGALIAPIFILPLRSFVSAQLMMLIAALFGPFVSLIISLVYPRIEFWIGQKLGGKASFDDLYRIFAWSFLPVGFTCAITWLIIIRLLEIHESVSLLFASIPALIILCFAIRNYCFNVNSAQQLSTLKGVMSILATLIFFVIIPVWIIVLFSFIIEFVKKIRTKYWHSEDNGEKIATTGVKRIGIAIALFYVVLFSWIALYDEKPDPQMMKELSSPVPDIFRTDNAWLAFFGFNSQTGGRPPFTKEEKMLRTLKLAIKGNKNSWSEYSSAKQNKTRLFFQGKIPEIYANRDNGIWEYVLNHSTDVDNLLRDNNELLRKYEDLYSYLQYSEPIDYGYMAPIPEFSPIRNIQKIKLMQLARVAQKGDFGGALLRVQNDAEFWRFIVRDSNTLISKLISISLLNSDIKFVAELCAHHRLSTKELETVTMILRPFNQGEESFTKALRGEAYITILGIESSLKADMKVKSGKYLFNPLVKLYATKNRLYSFCQKGIELSERKPQDFGAEVTKKEFRATDSYVKFSFLYNPAGEILAAIAKIDTSMYIEKGHNLEGLRRLARLSALSSVEGVMPENMRKFLKDHREELSNPYTGAPMNWDSQKKRIYFMPVREGKPIEIYM